MSSTPMTNPVRTKIPCGTESGWHIHPGEEAGC